MAHRPGTDGPGPVLPPKRDRFGLRTRCILPATLMRDAADRLARLGEERETPVARAQVEDVLRCPWWGLRVLAIRVLASWGGKRNKAWLMDRAGRRTVADRHADRAGRWHNLETETARHALRPLLKAEDGPWLLDAWFEDAGRKFGSLASGLGLVPEAALEVRLQAETASDEAGRRMGALQLVLARRGLACGPAVARVLTADADPAVQSLAIVLRRWFEMAERDGRTAEPVAGPHGERPPGSPRLSAWQKRARS